MTTLDYSDIGKVIPRVLREDETSPVAFTEPPPLVKLDRRQFLKLTGLVGGGLMLSFSPLRKVRAQDGTVFSPNVFVKIDAEGILLYAPNPEIGQGVKTSLPMMLAEELDVAWEDVRVVQAPIDTAFGSQFAGGSMSTPMAWEPLRAAGATARHMLVEAAAQKWQVSADTLSTQDSMVKHTSSGREISYHELATDAAKVTVPPRESIKFKDSEQYRLLGQRITGVDNDAIVRGKPLFGIDQNLPGLKYAVYQKCPAIGGTVKSANLNEIKQMPGVLQAGVLAGTGNAMEVLPGVFIIAESTWAAFQAKRALQVEWDENNASKDSWSETVTQATKLVEQAGNRTVDTGDVDAAFAANEQHAEGLYKYFFVSHAPLEPQNCTALFKDGELELWAPTQTPGWGMGPAASAAGVDRAKVKLNQLRCGGGFGRRLYNDFMCEAAAIAASVPGTPIKLQWTREDDISYDLFRGGGFHKLRGCVDEQGKIVGWHNRHATITGDQGIGSGQFPMGMVDNLRVEHTGIDWKHRCAAWRAPGSNVFGFVLMSFLHELAHAGGRDHRDVLLEVLGEERQLHRGGMHTGRAAACVKLATEKAGWTNKKEGRGLGVAFYYSHAGHIAEVAEVSVGDVEGTVTNRQGESVQKRSLKVHKVTVAADVGPIINLSGAENQVQGSVVDGLSTMMDLAITFENGRVQETNFDKYRMLRMAETPEVDVHFIDTGEHSPTGLGEPAFPPLAPAVGNAIFDACGYRVRTLPISEEGFYLV